VAAVAAQPASPLIDLVDALNNTKPRTPKQANSPKNKSRSKLPRKLNASSKLRSTPRLLSASRLLSPSPYKSTSSSKLNSSGNSTPSGRTGIFKKNRSPVIKSSLSQSALGKINTGKMNKMRLKGAKNDENAPRGGVVLDASLVNKSVMGKKSKSAAMIRNLTGRNKKPVEKRMLQLIDENSRPMSRSMAHLVASPVLSSPRYLTRRIAKISKSMNDLLEV